MATVLESQPVRQVLERLLVLGAQQERADGADAAPEAIADEVGRILHSLVLAARPQFVVEFGTSFGTSTIYFAAALSELGQGRLLTTELVGSKAHAAYENLHSAGLDDVTEIRHGDARETLANLDREIDMLFLDGANDLYVQILQMLEPQLATGAVIAAVLSHKDFHHERYRAFLDAPDGAYASVEIPIDAGLIVSARR